jgi:hypothetical protein
VNRRRQIKHHQHINRRQIQPFFQMWGEQPTQFRTNVTWIACPKESSFRTATAVQARAQGIIRSNARGRRTTGALKFRRHRHLHQCLRQCCMCATKESVRGLLSRSSLAVEWTSRLAVPCASHHRFRRTCASTQSAPRI